MDILKKINLKDNTRKLSKIDWIIMGIMVLLYGILSFIRLGSTSVPITYKTFEHEEDEIAITLEEVSTIGKMRYYTGNYIGMFDIYTSVDGKNYKDTASIEIGSVFTWQDVNLFTDAKYIKIICKRDGSTLGEIAFYGGGNTILPMVMDDNNPLIDETNTVPNEISFMNSTYFDEIYYGRTVYEFTHGISAYEWTHPPLGKLLMTIPVVLFGFSPFNYRLMGNYYFFIYLKRNTKSKESLEIENGRY